MEQYQIVKAESSYKDFVINLNMENMPAVGGLDEDSFDKFIKYSDYFKNYIKGYSNNKNVKSYETFYKHLPKVFCKIVN